MLTRLFRGQSVACDRNSLLGEAELILGIGLPSFFLVSPPTRSADQSVLSVPSPSKEARVVSFGPLFT